MKEMTETFLSRDMKSTLAIELNSASQEEIHEAYSVMQVTIQILLNTFRYCRTLLDTAELFWV